MKAYMKMPRELFSVFRQYLTQYPDGNRNASGAFIGMPRLQLRLSGSTPTYEEFLRLGMEYFSIGEQEDIDIALDLANQGNYLVSLCEQLKDEHQLQLAYSIRRIIIPIRDFRLSHLAAVHFHVPQALPEGLKHLKSQIQDTEEESIIDDQSNSLKGTAGFLPGPLLRNTLRMDLRAIDRLDTIIKRGNSL
jgi:hypothetical protein